VKPDFNGPVIYQGDSVYDGATVFGWNYLTLQIDVPAIYSKGANSTEDARILWHAVATAVQRLAGNGEHGSNRMAASDGDVSGAAGRVMMSNGERCRARNFSDTQPNNLYWATTAGCQDN
jgi:hypothetical protein